MEVFVTLLQKKRNITTSLQLPIYASLLQSVKWGKWSSFEVAGAPWAVSDVTSLSFDGETASVTLMFSSARASRSKQQRMFQGKRYDGRYWLWLTKRKTFFPSLQLQVSTEWWQEGRDRKEIHGFWGTLGNVTVSDVDVCLKVLVAFDLKRQWAQKTKIQTLFFFPVFSVSSSKCYAKANENEIGCSSKSRRMPTACTTLLTYFFVFVLFFYRAAASERHQ